MSESTEHPLVDQLRDAADTLQGLRLPWSAALMYRAADVIEELHAQNTTLRRTCGMDPLPPVDSEATP
jgi:hypothetical protein